MNYVLGILSLNIVGTYVSTVRPVCWICNQLNPLRFQLFHKF